jgi:hypothetical protein
MGPKGQAHGTKVAGCILKIACEGKVNNRQNKYCNTDFQLRMKYFKSSQRVLLLPKARIGYTCGDMLAIRP